MASLMTLKLSMVFSNTPLDTHAQQSAAPNTESSQCESEEQLLPSSLREKTWQSWYVSACVCALHECERSYVAAEILLISLAQLCTISSCCCFLLFSLLFHCSCNLTMRTQNRRHVCAAVHRVSVYELIVVSMSDEAINLPDWRSPKYFCQFQLLTSLLMGLVTVATHLHLSPAKHSTKLTNVYALIWAK